MKRPFLIPLTLLALMPCVALAADTFVLKNGDKVKGDLVRETEKAYYVNVHVAATIREEKEILKTNVVRVTKPEAGLIEFEQLQNLVPTPDGLRVGDYEQRIELMKQFIENFPASRNIRKAMDMRDELVDELRQVKEGAVKIDNVLYPATELRENQYELDARIMSRKIKDLIANDMQLAALREYSQFKKAFSHTQVHLDLIPLMQKVISSYSAQAAQLSETFNFRVEEREKGLERMKPADRVNSLRAIQAQKDELSRRFRLEVATQVGWVTPHSFSKESLDRTVAYAKTELREIDALLSRGFVDCGKLYRELYQMQSQGSDDKDMRDKLRVMQRAGVPSSYLEKFSS